MWKSLTFPEPSYIISWSQAAVQHEQDHSLVSLEAERGQQFVDLIVVHWPRDTLHGFDVD